MRADRFNASILLLSLLAVPALAGASPAQPAEGAPPSTPAAVACDPVEGVEGLPTAPLVIFGEIHGTDSGPVAFGNVVCHLTKEHGRIVVGLEIAYVEQERIDAYLGSQGGDEDRERLLAGPFWTDDYQDGRRSRAMAELLATMRRLRAAGIDLEVVAFDPLPGVDLGQREQGMAENLVAARREHPDVPFVALAGNIHPRTERGTPWDAEFLPMGARIEAAGVDVFPVDMRHAGGSAWICTGSLAADCGARPLRGPGEPRERPAVELFPEPETATGYAGALWIGEIEASPPAVEELRASE